jgi:hypothetical protein
MQGTLSASSSRRSCCGILICPVREGYSATRLSPAVPSLAWWMLQTCFIGSQNPINPRSQALPFSTLHCGVNSRSSSTFDEPVLALRFISPCHFVSGLPCR